MIIMKIEEINKIWKMLVAAKSRLLKMAYEEGIKNGKEFLKQQNKSNEERNVNKSAHHDA